MGTALITLVASVSARSPPRAILYSALTVPCRPTQIITLPRTYDYTCARAHARHPPFTIPGSAPANVAQFNIQHKLALPNCSLVELDYTPRINCILSATSSLILRLHPSTFDCTFTIVCMFTSAIIAIHIIKLWLD